MKGLIIKDLYYQKTMVKVLLFSFIWFYVLAVLNASITVVATMSAFLAINLMINSISFDETSTFSRYALSLGITRKEIIKSKYLLFFIDLSMVLIINIILVVIFSLFGFYFDSGLGNSILIILLVGIVAYFFGLTALPLVYKVGAQKVSYLYIGICVILFLGILFFGRHILQVLINFDFLLKYLKFIGVAMVICIPTIIQYISYKFSCRFINQKEF